MCNLFYRSKYTNWLIFICSSQYFLACNILFNPSVYYPKNSAYALYILSPYFVFCTNQLLTSSLNIIYLTETFVVIISGVYGLIRLKSKWFNIYNGSFTSFSTFKLPWMWLSINSVVFVYFYACCASPIEYTFIPKDSYFPQTFGFVGLNTWARPLKYEWTRILPNPLPELIPRPW